LDLSWIQIKILEFFGIAKSVRVARINSEVAEQEAASRIMDAAVSGA
jgi:hypothetical protein